MRTTRTSDLVMRKLFILFSFIFLTIGVFSQADTTVIFQQADSLNKLGDKLLSEGKYNESYGAYSEAVDITKDIEEGNNTYYATAMHSIGWLYYLFGDDNNALQYFMPAMEIRKKILGEGHPLYAKSLNGIGLVYSNRNDYENALKYIMQAAEIRRIALGEEHPDYANSVNNVGIVYKNIGDYTNALKYYGKAMEIRRKIYGEEHSDYAASLNNIGIVYYLMGDYPNTLKYFIKTMEIRKKVFGEEHPVYAESLENIGVLYFATGDYINSLKYYMLALNNYENVHGMDNPDYAKLLNNIAMLYRSMGDNKNALKYQMQALEIRKNVLGEDHIDYAQSLNNIGSIFADMGDYETALKYQMQALEIRKQKLGDVHPDYAATLDEIGTEYYYMNDYENALKYYLLAMDVFKKSLGEDHPDYAMSLNNIGVIYEAKGEYQNALKYEQQALEIRKKVLGEDHPDYANSLNNIGTVYNDMRDFRNALDYYNKAIQVCEKVLGKEHLQYAISLNNSSRAYFNKGDYRNAVVASKQATDVNKNNIIRNFSYMTSHEREAYWNANNKYFSYNINYMYYLPNDTLATKTSYDTELITKGLLLASEISMTNIIMESGDTTLIAEYENMKAMHLQLNRELEKPIAERKFDCDSLGNEIQKMERHIMEKSKEFGDITHFIKIDWKDVQNSLKSNDVAIEFSNFTENDTTKFVALVLTKGMDAPVCVPLLNNYEMQKLQRGITSAKTETKTDDENRGATTVAAKRQGIYESTGLYDMLWKPLEKYFPENPRIYFAPSGMLHQIAVEYAPISHEQTISDKYEIYRVSSTRFLAMDYMPKPMKNSVLYGGIYYDSDTTTMKQESDRYSTRRANGQSSSISRSGDREGLNYLPGTKTEVENIVGTLKKKKKVKSTLYEGSAANEESFKALSGKNIDVLHIATHGFFLPTDEKLSGDQSLVQSGLLLSGANYAWQNQPIPEGVEDGILTAKEISFMDLRKTDLVVLSACQTALGEITGEGVFGLQRGFKKAGVRTIIMSLWPVDDNATLLMMTEFYTNLTKGMSKREAFLAAQNKVKNTAGFENPRYWAAFIMLDGNN